MRAAHELADTSVLIAGCVETHPRHRRASSVIEPLLSGRGQLVVSAHSLLEMYAGLSAMPLAPRLTPDQARQLVSNVAERARVVTLSRTEYLAVITECSLRGLIGGVVYDALHAACARKEKVKRLWTFNRGDFLRVWPDGVAVIVEPPEV